MKDDGTMARLPDLIEFARLHGLKIGAITDLIHYRSQTERLIERVGERPIRTAAGDFRLVTFRDKLADATHLALVRGDIVPEQETVVRVHEPLSIVDLLDYGSRVHSWTIPAALSRIASAERGVLVLLHRPESALDLRDRALADQPRVESKMDLRNYGIGAQILRDLNVGKMRLLARPRKMPSMAGSIGRHRLRELPPSRPERRATRRRASGQATTSMPIRRIVRQPRRTFARRHQPSRFNPRSAMCCWPAPARAVRRVWLMAITIATHSARWKRAGAATNGADRRLRCTGRSARHPGRHLSFRDRRQRIGCGDRERAARVRHPYRQRHPDHRYRRAGFGAR
jgi:GTP cyclohydrolase II